MTPSSNLLMISGDRSLLAGKRGAFWYTLEEFSKHWDRIDIICPYVAVSDKRLAISLFGNVFLHPSPRGLWYQPLWILKKGGELSRQCHYDVTTVHEYPPFYNGIGALLLRLRTRIPAVLEIHHLVGYPIAASFTEYVGRILTRIILPLETAGFAAVRTVSKATATTLLSWWVAPRKVSVVPSFYLDHAMFSALEQSPMKHYDIAFCARLVPNKGLPELLKALQKLPSATLLIIGDGPERQRYELLARTFDVAHRVEFRGWVSTQEEMLRLLQTARVFVMNSKSEGGPRIALEAMAAGLPVLATKVGVMPEVIEDGVNGIFTTGTPEDLADKIDRLLRDNLLRERIGNEARKILERFERKRLIANYANFLKNFT